MVYVDNVKFKFRNWTMCHMVADSTDELNEMADEIGLKRSWIQHPGTSYEHYDITMNKRKLAVKHGAKELKSIDLCKIMKNKIV